MLFASTIPFVGRQTELHRIAAFTRHATEGDGLAALWITGEAGMGKSRLIEQALPDIEAQHVIVLRVRFYPDSPSGIVSLLHAALVAQPQAAVIARLSDTHGSVEVLNAIRRLARLRRTVIICEDVHYLQNNVVTEFTRFLSALVHEPTGLICTTRPGDFPAYHAVLPYIVQTLSLSPLVAADLDMLLEQYGIPEKDGVLLHRITRGVPIIIRSVLPELIEVNSRTIGTWTQTAETAQLLRDKAAMSISAIVREAINRLAPEEYRAASMLAGLGEVFAEQGAEILLGEKWETILDSLQRKGVIASPMSVPQRVLGEWNGGKTWEFTHLLLHEELANITPLGPDHIAHLMERDVALYSDRPLLKIAQTGHQITDSERRIRMLYILISHLKIQIGEYGWQYSKPFFTAVCEWFAAEEPTLSKDVRESMKLTLTYVSTLIPVYQPGSTEVEYLLTETLQTTQHPQTPEEAIRRFIVLSHIPPPNYRDLPEHINELLDEIDTLTTQFPFIAGRPETINALASVTGKMRLRPVNDQIRRVRAHLTVVKNELTDGASDPVILENYCLLAGHLIPLFTTPEDLADRDQLAQELYDLLQGEIDVSIGLSWGHYLINSGRPRPARTALYELIVNNYQTRPAGSIPFRFLLLFIEALLGAPLPYIEKGLKQMLAQVDETFGASARDSYLALGLALRAIGIGKLTGEFDWGWRIATEMVGNVPHVADIAGLAGLFSGTQQGLEQVIESTMVPEAIRPILLYVAGEDDDRTTAEDCVAHVLNTPIVHIEQTFEVRSAIALLEYSTSTERNLLQPGTAALIGNALRNGTDWCCNNELTALAYPLLEYGTNYLAPEELTAYHRRLSAIRASLSAEFNWEEVKEERRLPLLKLIGSIGVVAPEGTQQRVQGARGRRILGLMVANSLMDRPQNAEEFRAIAAEDEADSANTVRVAIARLRTLLGKEAIITNGSAAPRLNERIVRVDLLDALGALDQCEYAIQSQQPRMAKNAAMNALDIVRGEPAYPTLYGKFFEAARLDFELRLRQTILAAARFLRREEDYEEATDLLRSAFSQMPNDEEIAEELIAILQRTGRNAEGVSVQTSLGNTAKSMAA